MKELAAAKTKKNFIIGQPIVDFGLWLYTWKAIYQQATFVLKGK